MPEIDNNCNYIDHDLNSSYKFTLRNSHISSMEEYNELYNLSIEKPDVFWTRIANQFVWKKRPQEFTFSYNFDCSLGPITIKWMEDAETNICYNALDLNVQKGLGNKIAFYWEGNDESHTTSITYEQLLKQVCKFANVLKAKGIQKGDRVTIYLPMILELVVAVLACSRIGAVHNVVFGGFSAESLAERIIDSESKLLVTADGAWRGTKLIRLKAIADDTIALCQERGLFVRCVVVNHLHQCLKVSNGFCDHQLSKRSSADYKVSWNCFNDLSWQEEMEVASSVCEPEWVPSEHPLFILYTSGSTGKPKGVVHTTAGYMLYTATTFQYAFAYHSDDIYFCTADIGWITGHSYGIYGPLLQGATCLLFQGIPTYPDPGRYWSLVEKYKITTLYTAPTAIRTLMKYGDFYVKKYCLDSLKVLGTVGEPINPEAWYWYYKVVGGGRCPVIDTYWQSETGGHVITPLPKCTPLKPGSATLPFFGVLPAIVNDSGNEIIGEGEGHLVFKKPWPGIMRNIHGDSQRFVHNYFKRFPGYYYTGDGARRDSDGYYWITGRTDDLLNVSGHLLSTAEVESALGEHEACAESAVVACPHPVKGECLYCYIVLKEGYIPTNELTFRLREKVRSKIGVFATPEYIHFASALPKTRSGKILRRILRKISQNDKDLGDISTLADSSVVEELFSSRPCIEAT